MYNKFLQWLIPILIGKRTFICNAHIRGGVVLHEPFGGSLIYGTFIDQAGVTGVNADVEYLAD